MDLCVIVCYFVDSCPLRALQKVLEGPRALERAVKKVIGDLNFKN